MKKQQGSALAVGLMIIAIVSLVIGTADAHACQYHTDNTFGDTPIHAAVRTGDVAAVRSMVATAPNLNTL